MPVWAHMPGVPRRRPQVHLTFACVTMALRANVSSDGAGISQNPENPTWQAPSEPVELQVAPQPGCASDPVSPTRILDNGSGSPPGVALPSSNAAICMQARFVWVQMYRQAKDCMPPSCGNPSGRLQTRCRPVLAITNTRSLGSYRERMSWARAHVLALDDNAPACRCCSHCCQVSGLPPGCHRLRGPVCQEAVSQSHKLHLLDLGKQALAHLQAP